MWPFKSFINLIRLVYKPKHTYAHQSTEEENKIKPLVIELKLQIA